MPEDQRRAYIQAMQRVEEFKQDVLQLADDYKLTEQEINTACVTIMCRSHTRGLFGKHHFIANGEEEKEEGRHTGRQGRFQDNKPGQTF